MKPNETPKPTVVHVSRAVEPAKAVVSPEAQRRHERSRAVYPQLNLSEGEYVVKSVRRHPIGLITPQVIGVLLITITLTILTSIDDFMERIGFSGELAQAGMLSALGIIFIIAVVAGMSISAYVYTSNKFFLTNESVIQEIQNSLFSRHEQTVSLANIEDASFTQNGILQHALNYGSVRLSTEGDETTYRFNYVSNPKRQVDTLNNVVEAFKNGRPIEY